MLDNFENHLMNVIHHAINEVQIFSPSIIHDMRIAEHTRVTKYCTSSLKLYIAVSHSELYLVFAFKNALRRETEVSGREACNAGTESRSGLGIGDIGIASHRR